MAIISTDDDQRVVEAYLAISSDTVQVELSSFVATTLNLNPSQRAQLLPDPTTPADDERVLRLERIAAMLIAARNRTLQDKALIPSGVIFKQSAGDAGQFSYFIEGLIHYLSRSGQEDSFVARVRNKDEIRGYLCAIGDGVKLEALAGSILRKMFAAAYATRGSFDQGIDCFASDEILHLHSWCLNEEMVSDLQRLGERVHIIASCKANEGNDADGKPAILPPAHLRELIGGWLIQRCDSGLWHRRAGIKFLSPLQLLLVTTYRLSDPSLSLCQEMGVAVWGVPGLIYLICEYAPDEIFPAAGGHVFSVVELDKWVGMADQDRAVPEVAVA